MMIVGDAVRSAAARFCDLAVPVERLHAYLTTAADRLLRDGRAFSGEGRGDIVRAAAILCEIGLLEGALNQTGRAGFETPGGSNSLASWAPGATSGGIVPAHLVPLPLANAILSVAELGEGALSTPGCIESLLRQAEVRRLSSESLKVHGQHKEPARLLVADVALLLVRYARWNTDIRALNTAFKINDREFATHCGAAVKPSTARYLLALAEQERAAKELLS